ncbi:MAG TPA: peptidylprolyl isomerase [Tepidisphaeraceae bacterium]
MTAKTVQESSPSSSFNVVEDLEARILCRAPRPAKIATAFLDNRGQAFFTVTVALDTSTLSRKTAALYLAGADNTFGTADDVRAYTKVGYRKGRLSLRSDAITGVYQKYRVVLNGSVIKDVNGLNLDGEFNPGDGEISGDGTPGGNYDVVANTPNKSRARFSTAAGFINVGLYKNTPITKSNFVTYTNAGDYDSTIFHREIKAASGGIDIVQGGGYTLNAVANTTGQVTSRGDFNSEGTNLNVKGTLAMANAGVTHNNSQWFFNVNDNPGLDTTPGTYTVFGAVLDTESQNTLNALLALPTSGTDAYPLAGDPSSNTDVPVRSIDAINARQAFSPKDDLITVDRIAMLMDIVPSAGITVSAQPAGVIRSLATAPAAAVATATPFSAVQVDKKNSVLDEDSAAA